MLAVLGLPQLICKGHRQVVLANVLLHLHMYEYYKIAVILGSQKHSSHSAMQNSMLVALFGVHNARLLST